MDIQQILVNLQQVLTKIVDRKRIFGVSASIENGDGSLTFAQTQAAPEWELYSRRLSINLAA